MPNRLPRTLAALVAVLALVVTAGPAADPGRAQTAGPGDPVAVVLDASGSMTATDAGGVSRMDAAKKAAGDLVGGMGDERQFSLLTYGTSTGSADADKPAGCRDVTTLRPLRAGDVEGSTRAIAGITPSGYTPIGAALRAAAGTLPTSGARSVILVSDGEDTCSPPPPCDVARELKAQGVDLVVHTVGLNIDPRGREELSCIAQSTGGTYADASDTASLTASMSSAARTAEGYRLSDNRVDGAPGRWSLSGSPDTWSQGMPVDAAPVVRPGTPDAPVVLSSELPAFPADFPAAGMENGMLRAYRVHLEKGDVLRIGVISPGRAFVGGRGEDSRSTLRTDVVTPSGGVELGGWDPLRGDGDPAIANQTLRAAETGDHTVVVERRGGDAADRTVPFELRLGAYRSAGPESVEPGQELPSRAATDLPIAPPGPPVAAGTEPANAAPVGTGTVTAEIVPGETRYFRVPVGWGQGLAVHTRVDEPGDAPADAYCLQAALLNPMVTAYPTKGTRQCTFDRGPGAPEAPGAEWLEKTLAWKGDPAVTVAGDHFVAVTLSARTDGGSTVRIDPATARRPLRFSMAVDVPGRVRPGPVFQPITGGPGAERSLAAEPSGAPAAQPAAADDGPSRWLVPAGLAAGLLLALGVGAALVLRRRRR